MADRDHLFRWPLDIFLARQKHDERAASVGDRLRANQAVSRAILRLSVGRRSEKTPEKKGESSHRATFAGTMTSSVF
jgi:hypothetical protein